ncbi:MULTISPECIES: hypothetical protein [Streptomyces]|uniref:hypothetical protein n=1 Tax=Streptomyces TaxID=1883 RepID=UPI001F43167B|nr:MULTISPECIES: hypothetical protein [Streptomyces]
MSAVVALAGAAVTAVLGYWAQRRLRTAEHRNLMDAYGASLAWAAYDLQSRLYNILNRHTVTRGFLTAFILRGSPAEAEYARRSTVFVLAEYLGWVEILRRDVQFLDLGGSRTNQRVMLTITEIARALNWTYAESSELRLFRAQQRAIGELMVHPEGEPGRRRCLGYAEFSARLDTDEEFRGWFRPLLADVDALAADTEPAVPRLVKVQWLLIELLDLLDPRSERFPDYRRPFREDPSGSA